MQQYYYKIAKSRCERVDGVSPQTDRMTERMNCLIGQIFRAEIHPNQKDWMMCVNLTEFTINASVSQTMKFAPFKLNGRYLPSMLKEYPQGSTPPGVCKFAQQALINVVEAHDSIIESRVFQTHHANKRRTADPTLNKGDMVYLSTRNLNLQKGWVCKLCPKYIGPYKIDDAHLETSTYTLQLPVALQEQRIHLTFHISLL